MESYDYIVIGAGSAGCVVANRLSADPARSVLLLEAGGPDTNRLIHIPGTMIELFDGPEDWNFSTEPQRNVLGRRIVVPRGKVFGGSSSINAMAYVRGNREDYDGWALMGCEGWDYESVLPLFKRSEGHNDYQSLDPAYHSADGPLRISRDDVERSPFCEAFIKAACRLGIPRNDDFNGAQQFGAGLTHMTWHKGRRQSCATAFLTPVLKRPNLTARPYSLARRILFEGQSACGVEVEDARGNCYEVSSKKCIVLCAGAIASPQLLMLSGIGDAADLKKLGIRPVRDVPAVGANLHDHLFAPASFLASQPLGINHHNSSLSRSFALLRYLLTNGGPAASVILQAMAFIDIDRRSEKPNFQLHFCPFNAMRGQEFDLYGGATDPILEDGFTLLASLVQPASRGQLRLASADPHMPPLIDPQFLSVDSDADQLLKGMKLAKELLEQQDFDAYRGRPGTPTDWSSDEAIVQRTKETLETIYHPVGTCRMGNDRDAVVDPELRVNGIEGLRVADASIMPRIITGNTNAPCVMIGEKAADLILKV